MDLSTDVFIKEEDDDKNKDLDLQYDVKIEQNSPLFEEDWSIFNDVLFENRIVEEHVLGYEELHDEFLQRCFRCYQLFGDSYSLIQHNITHLSVKLFKLKEDQIISKDNHEYFNTIKIENNNNYDEQCLEGKQKIDRIRKKQVYQCDNCSKVFYSKSMIAHHLLISHRVNNIIIGDDLLNISNSLNQCRICGKIFTYKRWHEHITEVHSIRKLKCKICKSIFKSKHALQKHKRYVHEGYRPSWRFHSVNEDVKAKCTICSAMFNNKNSLKTHVRNCHTSSVECNICNSKLKCNSYLLAHMRRVHYDDGKVHSCDICGKIFKSPRYVRVHIKNTHRVKSNKEVK